MSGRTTGGALVAAILMLGPVTGCNRNPDGLPSALVAQTDLNRHYPVIEGAVPLSWTPCPVYETPRQLVEHVVAHRGSILLATVTVDESSRSADGQSTLARLSDVTTLAGPGPSADFSVWMSGHSSRELQIPADDRRDWSMWAPDGRVIAAVLPADPADAMALPRLRLTPVDGNLLITSEAGCWKDRTTTRYEYSGPLMELTNSQTIAWAGPWIAATSLPDFIAAAKAVEGESG